MPKHTLRTNGAGRITYSAAELPVSMSGSGEPCVFTLSGWMTVAAFEAANLPVTDLMEAVDLAQTMPDGPTAASFAKGAGAL